MFLPYSALTAPPAESGKRPTAQDASRPSIYQMPGTQIRSPALQRDLPVGFPPCPLIRREAGSPTSSGNGTPQATT